MKQRILRRLENYFPNFSLDLVFKLINDPSIISEIMSELIDKGENQDWECLTLGKEISTLGQSILKIYNTAKPFIDSTSFIDIIISAILAFSPDQQVKKLVTSIMFMMKKIILSNKLSELTLTNPLSILNLVAELDDVEALDLAINGLTIRYKDKTQSLNIANSILSIIKKGGNIIGSLIAFYLSGPFMLSVAKSVTEYAINFAFPGHISKTAAGSVLVGSLIGKLESKYNKNYNHFTEYDGLKYVGGQKKLDEIKKIVNNSFNHNMINEYVSILAEILIASTFDNPQIKYHKFELIEATKTHLLNADSVLNELGNSLDLIVKCYQKITKLQI